MNMTQSNEDNEGSERPSDSSVSPKPQELNVLLDDLQNLRARNEVLEKKNAQLEHLAVTMPAMHSRLVLAETELRNLKLSAFNKRIFEILQLRPLDASFSAIGGLLVTLRSQLGQDLLALVIANFAEGGFFVEFGATDGVEISNTFILESKFGWTGILAEPAKAWHAALLANRNCVIDLRCVWSQSKQELLFSEAGEFSTITEFENADMHALERRGTEKYTVETISLNDLLSNHNAPSFIDFLSLDTEGSELSILKAVDFNSYTFGLICVEHNFTEANKKIQALLESHGYFRILENFSEWDGWFVHEKSIRNKGLNLVP